MPLDEVVIVDADTNVVESPFDDLAQLPSDTVSVAVVDTVVKYSRYICDYPFQNYSTWASDASFCLCGTRPFQVEPAWHSFKMVHLLKHLLNLFLVTLVVMQSLCFPVSGRLWSFRSKYNKLFRSEPEICLIDSFFYPTKERNNSFFLERKLRGTKWP